MQQLSNEAVLGIIAIVATLIGAYAYVLKRRADALLLRVQAEAEEAKAVLTQKESESKARILREQAEASQMERMMGMFNQQMEINRQYSDLLRQSHELTERNYRVLADSQRDVGQMVMTEVQIQSKRLYEKIEAIPTLIQNSNAINLGDFARTLAGELAISIAEQFDRQKADSTLYPFPDPDDPDWREDWVYPLEPEVTIRKEPRFWDNALLKKPCAQIATSGEKIKIISGRMTDWLIVDKTAGGERCWGWVKLRQVRIGEALPAA